ncbi:neprilysin-2-like [Belonocnema kinseyi]|uniref:neprilysin-2-like n=1 Tax=Belonocnema kinseyi TaxID=2817044 RepID=UPI00143D44A3|nr:neprilysin-2-like [Belonocnema kinseyi]
MRMEILKQQISNEILHNPNIYTVKPQEGSDTSSIIKDYMDPKVAPCDDFNKFVCGNFLRNTTIPKGQRRVDRYDIINNKILEQVKVSLEEKTQPNEPRWITLVKNYYKSCTNTAVIEKNGLRGALDDLKKFGGWPVLENTWNERKFEWKQSTYTMMKLGYGASYFFNFQIITDPLNSKKRVINIDQPAFSISREFLVKGLSHRMVTVYLDYMVDIAVLFGANREKAKTEMKESLKFEINLATISKGEHDKSNQTAANNRMTVTDLSEKYRSIPWKVYFNSLYSAIKSSIVIDDKETIIVGEPSFFKDFEKLIKNTPRRALATYLKLSIGALYVRKHFSPTSKESAEELALDIENQYKKMIQEAKWMDEKTRINALNRLASMKNFIGCPNEFFDDKILNEFFKNAEATPNDYFQAASTMSVFSYYYDFNQLRQSVNTSHWTLHGQTAIVGPFFSEEGNGIEMPAGNLQDVFFVKGGPQYMNYAGIGSFNMGHEITELFDTLDAYMTPETKKTYLANADCITKQYGKYTAEEVGLRLNGASTQRTNINDNAGVKVAYLAYQEWVKRNGPEPKLPGLTNYSQSQLFWIHAAIQQCAKYTPEFLKKIVQTNDHSPSEFRIIEKIEYKLEEKKNFDSDDKVKLNNLETVEVDLNKMASGNSFADFQSEIDDLEEYLERFELCMLAAEATGKLPKDWTYAQLVTSVTEQIKTATSALKKKVNGKDINQQQRRTSKAIRFEK